MNTPMKIGEQERLKIARDLKAEIGPNKVRADEGTRHSYSGTISAPKNLPDVVVLPDSVEDVRKILIYANKNRIPVTPVASGSQETSTNPLMGGIVVDTMGMKKIIEVNSDAAYILVEPGVTIGELAKVAREHGFRITVGSFPPGLSAIGNYILTNANTHRTTSRDDIVSLEAVLPDGTVVQTGSKAYSETYDIGWHGTANAYPDLKHLFMDAYGTLGIVTKAAIRLYSLNESRPLVVAAFSDYEKSLAYMKKIARANLVQHVCVWHWVLYTTINHLEIYKHGGTSDAVIYDPWETPDDRPYNLVVPTMSGPKEAMEGAVASLQRIIKEFGGEDYTEKLKERFPGAHQFYLDHYCEHMPTTTFMGGYGEAKAIFPIVIVDPARIGELEKWVLKRLRNSPLKFGLSYYSHSLDHHRSVFIRFTPFMLFESSEEDFAEAHKTYDEVMEAAFSKYGAVPCRNGAHHDFFDPDESRLNRMAGFGTLLRKIKKAVDPNNILNPGFGITMYGNDDSKTGSITDDSR
jgi:FAD/FMN-containing dehydrogenase